MESKNSLATISPDTTSESQPGSSSEAIALFLAKAGEVYGKLITDALILAWIEELGGYPVEQLAGMFRHTLRTWKPEYGRTFPTIADVLKPVEDSPAPQAEADLKWQRVLDYIRVYYSPDLPGGASRGAPTITPRTMHAIRCAGGLAEIADCPREHLHYRKTAFLEAYTAWDTLKRDQYLLPDDSPVKALISGACKALPAPRDNWPTLRAQGLAHAELVKVADDLPAPRPPRMVIANPERYAELARQAAEIVAKYGENAK
jgi:hypothetical protein